LVVEEGWGGEKKGRYKGSEVGEGGKEGRVEYSNRYYG
jgi:hypothetical protein